MSNRAGGGVRRAVTKTVLVFLPVLAAIAAGRLLGGDWTWAAFSGAMVVIALVLLSGARRPAGKTTIQAAGRDLNTTNIRNNRFSVNAGGMYGVLGAVLIVAVDALLVAHVSTEVPGGRFYEPSGPAAEEAGGVRSTARAPAFLRDLEVDEAKAAWGAAPMDEGARIAGKECARSIYSSVSEVGRPAVITLTPAKSYEVFRALAGVPDGTHANVTVEFALLGDDRVVDSGTAGQGKPVTFDEKIAAYKVITLRATLITSEFGSSSGGRYRAVWGDAQLLPPSGRPTGCAAGAGT